jgi:hypothetical protein
MKRLLEFIKLNINDKEVFGIYLSPHSKSVAQVELIRPSKIFP